MSHGNALAALSSFSRAQLGLFTRAQAGTSRVSAATLRRLEQAALIERCSPQVFRLTSSARSWHQSVLVACLDGGADCVASHTTAAALHRLDGFPIGGIIEVLVPAKKRLRRSGVLVHRTHSLPEEDRTIIGAIPVTSLARTLLTLGASAEPDRVEEAYDSAERRDARIRAQLEQRYAELRASGRNGIGAMTHIRARRERVDRLPRSVLERKMRRLLAGAGFPPVTSRYLLRLVDGRIVELDFAIVEHAIDVEVDGHDSHSSRRQRAHDNARQADIEDAGWIVRRFTYEQVINEPHKVVASIRRAIATRKNDL